MGLSSKSAEDARHFARQEKLKYGITPKLMIYTRGRNTTHKTKQEQQQKT